MRNLSRPEANGKPLRAQYARILAGQCFHADDIAKPDFWEGAWREGVGACIWHALQQQDVVVDAAVKKQFIELSLRGQTAHTLMLRAASVKVLQLFSDAGIDMVMLRGQAVADTLYSPATSRPQTDIDVLIREQDVQRTVELLAGAGFSALPGHPLLLARGEVLLDVHIEPLGIERMASWSLLTPLRAEHFFQHARRQHLLGVDALCIDAALLLPYLGFHAMKHSFESLVWLWDIALLARHINDLDAWISVHEGIETYALQRPCFYALSYVHVNLATPVPQSLLDALRPEMDWRERQMFRRFMQHEQVPFLAERVFARMQPDFMHRLAFWRETIWPAAGVREQVSADPTSGGGFAVKRLRQIGRAVVFLLRETLAIFRA